MQITKPEMVKFIETLQNEFVTRFGVLPGDDLTLRGAQLQVDFLMEKIAIMGCAINQLERNQDEFEKRISRMEN